jgi:hypothetical protein
MTTVAIERMGLACAGVLALAACGGEGRASNTAGPSSVRAAQGLTVAPASTNLLKIGPEQAYTALVRWTDGTETTEAATWRSDAAAVASVDGAGRARALDTGEATLVARAQNIEGTLRIRVVPDYSGSWDGSAVIGACRETGAWAGSGSCSALPPGNPEVRISSAQDRDRVTGTLTFDGLPAPLGDTVIGADGGLSATARTSFTEDGVTLSVVFDPIRVRAAADRLTGDLTMSIGIPGFDGAVALDMRLDAGRVGPAQSAVTTGGGRRWRLSPPKR